MLKGRHLAIAVLALLLAPASQAVAAKYGSRALEQGDRGSDVRTLQVLLDDLGYATTADGVFGPGTASSVRAWESDVDHKVNGRVSRREARQLSAQAQQTSPATLEGEDADRAANPKQTGGASYVEVKNATIRRDGTAVAPDDAPPEVKAIIAAGNRIHDKPYRYGGGHGRWKDSGYDCSGSVSYALHGAGLLDHALDSTGFMSWGASGPGTWVTIYAHGGHVYMVVAGLRFDTSARKVGGSRWTKEMRSPDGFTVRHPVGL